VIALAARLQREHQETCRQRTGAHRRGSRAEPGVQLAKPPSSLPPSTQPAGRACAGRHARSSRPGEKRAASAASFAAKVRMEVSAWFWDSHGNQHDLGHRDPVRLRLCPDLSPTYGLQRMRRHLWSVALGCGADDRFPGPHQGGRLCAGGHHGLRRQHHDEPPLQPMARCAGGLCRGRRRMDARAGRQRHLRRSKALGPGKTSTTTTTRRRRRKARRAAELLDQLFEIQKKLAEQERPRAFLSVDVVGSSRMKTGADGLAIEHTFGKYQR